MFDGSWGSLGSLVDSIWKIEQLFSFDTIKTSPVVVSLRLVW